MGEPVPNEGDRKKRVLERFAGSDNRLCISVPEAAAMLGVSRNFGYELVRRGQLPARRFGKRLLIPRAALEKMLEKGQEQ